MGKRKGMQSLYLVQKGFVEKGHKVTLLVSDSNPFVPYSKLDVEEGIIDGMQIKIFRLPMSSCWILANFQDIIREKSHIAYMLVAGMKMFISLLIFFFYGTKEARRCIKHLKPDVIYGHTYYGAFIASVLGNRFRIPAVNRTYGIGDYSYIHRPSLLKLLTSPELLSLIMPFDLLIITNDGTKGNEVTSKLGLPNEIIRFWMNGVNKNRCSNMRDIAELKGELRIPDNFKVILSVGRLDNWKRVDRIIAAMPDIIKKYEKVMCLIVGDGPYMNKLKEQVRRAHIERNVRFVGAVLHNEVEKYMKVADVFISFQDISNLTNSLLEAMVCGKCIVTLDEESIRNLIKNKETGILIAQEDLKKLPHVTVDLLRNDSLRKHLGENAKKYALEHLWSWNERITREVNEVESLVMQSQKP